ncbi:MAG: magnesium transporter [Candidatus Spechtbacterales bacterium]
MPKKNKIQNTIQRINSNPDERVEIFVALPLKTQAQVVLGLATNIQYEILSKVPKHSLVRLLEYLDPDEATDIVGMFPPKAQKRLLSLVSREIQKEVSMLLRFDPETAGGLMNIDYVQVQENDTIANVAKRLEVHEKRTGRLPVALIMKNGALVGYLPMHKLIFASPGDIIQKYTRPIRTIKHTATHEEVLEEFRSHPHNKLIVTGENKEVLGIVYSDDILKFLHEQGSKSLYDFAGVSSEESALDTASKKISHRYKWLALNLVTSFIAAFTVGFFDSTISKYVMLAVFMPVVAGMGGNAATQTLAVLVRGIALNQITLATVWRTLRNELLSGLANGVLNGALAAGVVVAISGDYKIAAVLGVAMVVNLVIAGFFGTLVPLIMHRLGKDPASSATVFITTATDVFGFLAFLGLAAALLE